jgi:hypothetical protein
MIMQLKIWLFKQLYKSIAKHGREGDTELAHVNSYEVELLKLAGGSGTINPATGLREFKGGGGGTSTTNQSIDPAILPYITYGLEEAKGLYNQAGPQYYPSDTYIPASAQTTSALGLAEARAKAGNPLVSAAQTQMGDVIGGKYLGANPYLSAAMSGAANVATQAYNDAIQGTRSGASQAGRYGSNAMFDQTSRAQQNLANALSQEAGRLMYQNYGAERAAQQAAVQQAPQMAATDYADIQQLLATGQTQEDYARQKLEADIGRFEFGQNLPYSKLQSYLSAAYGAPTPMNQTTTQSGGGK